MPTAQDAPQTLRYRAAFTEFYDGFNTFTSKQCPVLTKHERPFSETFVSPFCAKISKADFARIEKAIKAFHKLRTHPGYQAYIISQRPELGSARPNENSLFQSFDFHLSPEGPKLIEINTNAGFSMGLSFLNDYRSQKVKLAAGEIFFHNANIREKFKNDFLSAFPDAQIATKRAAIIDETPKEQALYFEFLLFQELLDALFGECEILSPSELLLEPSVKYLKGPNGKQIDFAYNRCTDFYLSRSESKNINAAYCSRKLVLNPNPFDFGLLADKARLVEFSTPGFLDQFLGRDDASAIGAILPSALRVKDQDEKQLWAKRKNYFFKPFESYGGKAVYNGRGITTKVWESVLAHDYIAQELVSAPTISEQFTVSDSQELVREEYKFDLRFYTFGDEIRQAAPRFYQGQTTNFKTPLGGFGGLIIGST